GHRHVEPEKHVRTRAARHRGHDARDGPAVLGQPRGRPRQDGDRHTAVDGNRHRDRCQRVRRRPTTQVRSPVRLGRGRGVRGGRGAGRGRSAGARRGAADAGRRAAPVRGGRPPGGRGPAVWGGGTPPGAAPGRVGGGGGGRGGGGGGGGSGGGGARMTKEGFL